MEAILRGGYYCAKCGSCLETKQVNGTWTALHWPNDCEFSGKSFIVPVGDLKEYKP